MRQQSGPQPSRAQKRRDAKAAVEAEREARIAEEQDALGESARVVEERQLAATLAPLGLAVRSIPVRSAEPPQPLGFFSILGLLFT